MHAIASTYRHPAFREGMADMLGGALGVAAWGLMTGVAMVQSGMSTVEALLMASIVYAGSSQLAAIPLLIAGAPMAVILVTGFCVNLRFVVFSAHLRAYVMHLPRWARMLAGYSITDLGYVQLVQRFPAPATNAQERAHQMAYLAGGGLVNWCGWTGCSLLGVALANSIPAHWGLGFAGILALVGMLCSLATNRLRWFAAATAGLVGIAAYALPLKLNILVAIGVAVALGLLLEKRAMAIAHPARTTQGKG